MISILSLFNYSQKQKLKELENVKILWTILNIRFYKIKLNILMNKVL